MSKVLAEPDLIRLTRRERENGETVVLTNGCFDGLHVGHIRFLRACAELGTRLFVGINDDHSVKKLKGHLRPRLSSGDRAEAVALIGGVTGTCVFRGITATQLVDQTRPHVYVKGARYAGGRLPEAAAALRVGARIVFVPRVVLPPPLVAETGIGDMPEGHEILLRLLEAANDLRDSAYLTNQSVHEAAEGIFHRTRAGGSVFICGNGGFSAVADHFASELIEQAIANGTGIRAHSLTTNASLLTAASNDVSYENALAVILQGLAGPRDVLVAMSSSGESPNILAAAATARASGMLVIGIVGARRSSLRRHCGVVIECLGSASRSQDLATPIIHLLSEMVARRLSAEMRTDSQSRGQL